MRLLLSLFIALSGLYAFGSPQIGNYLSEDEKFFVDAFDFSGEYPEMETIEIHAQRKKRVTLDVSGNFPKLESIVYQGSFGLLQAQMTGTYPELSSLTMQCTACKMQMDFRGEWKQNAFITASNEQEPMIVILPKNVGVVVHTKTTFKGKVYVEGDYTKQGRGIWNRVYHNPLVGISPITLTFTLHSDGGGSITLR